MPVPFVPFANVVQASLNFTWRNVRVANVLNFQLQSGVITPAAMVDLGVLVRNWYQDTYQDGQTNDIRLDSIRMVDLSAQDAQTFTYTAGLPLTGLTPGNSVLNNTALVMSLGTLNRGRDARGRIYLAGLDAAQILENYWSSAYAQLFVTSLQTFLVTFGTAGWPLVVASRKFGKAWRTTGVARPVTSVSIKSLLAGTQRERLS